MPLVDIGTIFRTTDSTVVVLRSGLLMELRRDTATHLTNPRLWETRAEWCVDVGNPEVIEEYSRSEYASKKIPAREWTADQCAVSVLYKVLPSTLHRRRLTQVRYFDPSHTFAVPKHTRPVYGQEANGTLRPIYFHRGTGTLATIVDSRVVIGNSFMDLNLAPQRFYVPDNGSLVVVAAV